MVSPPPSAAYLFVQGSTTKNKNPKPKNKTNTLFKKNKKQNTTKQKIFFQEKQNKKQFFLKTNKTFQEKQKNKTNKQTLVVFFCFLFFHEENVFWLCVFCFS